MAALLNYRDVKIGDKLEFHSLHEFWFTNIVENGKTLLEVGKVYTVSSINPASSWVAVTMEETGDAEFSLHFFKRPIWNEANAQLQKFVKELDVRL